MKTKIFYGNQFVEKFTCDGKPMTIKQIIVLTTKRTFIVLSLMFLAMWLTVGGYLYAQKNIKPVTVWAESIKEVPVGTKFEDIPMLMKICKAESGNRQFNAKGDVLRGTVNPSDIGYCQINEYINNDLARKLGYDIFTEKGNKDFAVYLFLQRGTQPWKSSQCTVNGWGTKSECNK